MTPDDVPDPRCNHNLYKILRPRSTTDQGLYGRTVEYNNRGNCVHMVKYRHSSKETHRPRRQTAHEQPHRPITQSACLPQILSSRTCFFIIFNRFLQKSPVPLAERVIEEIQERLIVMEEIYKSLFSGNDLLSEQFVRQMFELSVPDGPVMIYVNAVLGIPNERFTARSSVFTANSRNNCPPSVNKSTTAMTPVSVFSTTGVLWGRNWRPNAGHCGYFLLFLPGYTSQTVQVNMDIFELILAQAQLVCQLIEKNNQLHRLRLADLSKTVQSPCLSRLVGPIFTSPDRCLPEPKDSFAFQRSICYNPSFNVNKRE